MRLLSFALLLLPAAAALSAPSLAAPASLRPSVSSFRPQASSLGLRGGAPAARMLDGDFFLATEGNVQLISSIVMPILILTGNTANLPFTMEELDLDDKNIRLVSLGLFMYQFVIAAILRDATSYSTAQKDKIISLHVLLTTGFSVLSHMYMPEGPWKVGNVVVGALCSVWGILTQIEK